MCIRDRQKGDLKNAEHYLRKAGESPEALYARGAYAMLTEEYETAAGYLQEAEKAGIQMCIRDSGRGSA